MVDMLHFDVGDHGTERLQMKKGAIALISLGNQICTVAGLGITRKPVDLSADNDRRIHAGMLKHHRNKRCGCCLAVSSGYRDPLL